MNANELKTFFNEAEDLLDAERRTMVFQTWQELLSAFFDGSGGGSPDVNANLFEDTRQWYRANVERVW